MADPDFDDARLGGLHTAYRAGKLRAGFHLYNTEEDVARLVEADADAIVVDTAHGHSKGVVRTLKEIKKKFPDTDIVVGNIATADAARYLVEAGKHHREHHEAEDDDVDREESPDRVDDAILDGLVAELDRDLGARVYQADDLAYALLVDEQPANDLDAARGGAAAAAASWPGCW